MPSVLFSIFVVRKGKDDLLLSMPRISLSKVNFHNAWRMTHKF